MGEADMLYACDAKWWDAHDGAPAFHGDRWTQSESGGFACAARHGLKVVKSAGGPLPRLSGEVITQGGNSGYQAVNLAVLSGARRVILIGFDMSAPDGRRHFFGNHDAPGLSNASPYATFVNAFNRAAPIYAEAGVTILNASRRSALKCFKQCDLERALS